MASVGQTRRGGLSGDDPDYKKLANQTVRRLYEEAGKELSIIGVGGVGDADAALEIIQNGASAVEVVTAIRPSRGRVAAQINEELLGKLDKLGVTSIQELIGVATLRGALK